MKHYSTHHRILFLLCLLLSVFTARASHVVGGETTYTYLGDSTSGGLSYSKYRISISIYEDCQNGQPEAIAEDDPAYIGIYTASGSLTHPFISDSIFHTSAVSVPSSFTTACGSSAPLTTCLIKKTFTKTYALPTNTSGYLVSYQRCCRNSNIVNILNPDQNGCTYSCKIPAAPTHNNSAIFTNYPPQIICRGLPLHYDHSATDADGDSLSYSFQAALNCCEGGSTVKPYPPLGGPFDSVTYISPFTSGAPMSGSPAITIDPVTGIITGTPNAIGRYLVTVYCYEWRAGTLINATSREFQFVTTDCSADTYHPFAGNDTAILEGDSIHFAATDGASFTWSPGTYLSSTTIADPVGHFPVAGRFTYTVHGISDSGCVGDDIINVSVYPYAQYIVPTGFSPHATTYLAPIPMKNVVLSRFKIFNRKGNLVYSGGPADPGWDGTYNGTRQDTGTYFWELEYTDNNGKSRLEKGDVTLIR